MFDTDNKNDEKAVKKGSSCGYSTLEKTGMVVAFVAVYEVGRYGVKKFYNWLGSEKKDDQTKKD